MHAVYSFLINIENLETDKEIAGHAKSTFESYIEHHGDENNWWALIDLVLPDGKVVPFDDGARWIPAENITFEEARLHALRCAANDLNLFDQPSMRFVAEEEDPVERLSFDELLFEIKKQTGTRLSEAYAKVARLEDETDWLADYRRGKHAKQLEKLFDCKVVPFTTSIDTPYDYRCYDLTDGDRNKLAILRVDIHT